MSPELLTRIHLELSLIYKEVSLPEILLKKSKHTEMDSIDCRPAAACLHFVYNGYENILL